MASVPQTPLNTVATITASSRASQATLAIDDVLQARVYAGHKYILTIQFIAVSPSPGYIQVGVAAPTGTVGLASAIESASGDHNWLPADADGSLGTSAFNAQILAETRTNGVFTITAIVEPVVDGAVGLYWAQSVSDATPTLLLPGALLTLYEIC